MNHKNGEIYTRWLNNQLTDAELEHLRQSGELAILQRIINETDSWELEPLQSSYADLRIKLQGRKQKTRVFYLFRPLPMAAAFALLASLAMVVYTLFIKPVNYSTLAGETREIKLPDNTKVILEGNSELSYQPYNWENDRVVAINGNVFFEVERKGDFVVNFSKGSVAVKGTAFDVLALEDFAQVKCYHGKVAVTFKNGQYLLTKGMGVDSDTRQFEFATTQTGNGGKYTRFENAKLAEVLASLSSKFGYTFELKTNYKTKLFTGQYDNTDGEKALRMVFNALSVDYTVKDKKVVLK